ncbi:hypothetical protein [Seleniivibrio woodruffii]|uniref:hypothetical protein n=1 Tax=Seleniivibrio woodruffii TaxID=1078050 RepID=UPI0026EA325C|nr:hypothetical protein [Seleniivibrio woodruffii]
MIVKKYLFITALMLFIFALYGCSEGSSSDTGQNVYSSIPSPDEHSGVSFHSAGLYSLSDSGKAKGRLGKDTVSDYSENMEYENSDADWSFSLDKPAMNVLMGEQAALTYENSINTFLGDIADHPSVLEKLNAAVKSFPLFSDTQSIVKSDISGNAQFKSISVADGVYTGDGTPKSLIRLTVVIPELFSDNNSAVASDCSAEVAQVMSDDSTNTYTQPADTVWTYGLDIVVTFLIDDQQFAHTDVDEDSVTQTEQEQWANDFGLLVWFLNNLNSHSIPSYDIVFSVNPGDELTASLGRIQGQAKTNENAACLMALDSAMPEPSLVIPNITGTEYLDTDYEYYSHKYSAELDNLSAGNEFGASCLHDADGNIISVGDDSTCAAGSGVYSFTEKGKTKDGDVSLGVISPYENHPDGTVTGKTTKGFCNSSPWTYLRTPRFGRGIRLALTEWAIHGQIADHWNIHWYQKPGKALAQSAISDAAYLIKVVAQETLVGGSWWGFAFTSAGQAYKYASKFNISIAGYRIGGDTDSRLGDLIVALIRYGTLTTSVKEYATSIGISETVEGVAQMFQTEVTGWQDYYSGSHKVCGYKFN